MTEHDEIQQQTPPTKKSGQSGPFVPLIERATNPFMRQVLAYMGENGRRPKAFQNEKGIHSQRWSTMAKEDMGKLDLTMEELAVFASGLHLSVDEVSRMYAIALDEEERTQGIAVEDLARAGTYLTLFRICRYLDSHDRADILLFALALADRRGKTKMPKRRHTRGKETRSEEEPALAG